MTYLGGSGLRLTSGDYYPINGRKGYHLMVTDNDGHEIWVSEDFFK